MPRAVSPVGFRYGERQSERLSKDRRRQDVRDGAGRVNRSVRHDEYVAESVGDLFDVMRNHDDNGCHVGLGELPQQSHEFFTGTEVEARCGFVEK